VNEHYFRVEVTIAACIATPDNRALGDNVVDVTFGFSLPMPAPPRRLTDREINDNLSHHVSPVAASINAALMSIGFASLGTIAEPMGEQSTPTGEFGTATPVSIVLAPATDAQSRGRVS
jgi:hypothetical protein